MSDYEYEYDSSEGELEDKFIQSYKATNNKHIKFNDIWNEINELVETVSEQYDIGYYTSLSKLIQNKWSTEIIALNNSKIVKYISECIVCYDTSNLVYVNECDHVICKECLEQYITINKSLACPGFKCNSVIHLNTLDRDLAELCKVFIINNYIDLNPNVFYCPSKPHCGYIIITSIYNNDTTTSCICGVNICIKCKESDNHEPLSCKDNVAWNNVISNGNTKYISTRCRICPWCGKLGERVSGCNHMTCTTDRSKHWCWACGGKVNTKSHGIDSIAGHVCKSLKADPKSQLHYITYYDKYIEYKQDVKAFVELKNKYKEETIKNYYDILIQSTTFASNLMIYTYLHHDQPDIELYRFNLESIKKNLSIAADILKYVLTVEDTYENRKRVEYLFTSLEEKIDHVKINI